MFKYLSKNSILNIVLFIVLLIIYFYPSSSPKIEGCTDVNAINYDISATDMKDSSCTIIFYKNINDKNYSSVNLKIDNNRFSDLKYEFIYPSSDTIKNLKRRKHLWHGNYSYWEYTISIPDTIKININEKGLSDHRIKRGKNIIVFETINDPQWVRFDSYKTYYMNLGDSDNTVTHLINPRELNKYKTERVGYSVNAFSSDIDEPIIKRYRNSFHNRIDTSINYWFEDHPPSISVDSRFRGTTYRTNIMRY